MGGTTEDMIDLAVRSLFDRDESFAAEVREKERHVNALEMDVDNRVVGLIVHHQPVARDARFSERSSVNENSF
jgi:phosphate transport system protein